jgi:hypothetical protein
MGRACGISRETENTHVRVWQGNLKETDHMGDLGIDRRIILE